MSKPFGYFEYIKLQENAYCVLSDSGSVSEESNILGFPAVLIRTSTERQEAEFAGAINHSGYSFDSIVSYVTISRENRKSMKTIDDYFSNAFSSRVMRCIFSVLKKY